MKAMSFEILKKKKGGRFVRHCVVNEISSKENKHCSVFCRAQHAIFFKLKKKRILTRRMEGTIYTNGKKKKSLIEDMRKKSRNAQAVAGNRLLVARNFPIKVFQMFTTKLPTFGQRIAYFTVMTLHFLYKKMRNMVVKKEK